MQRAMSISMHLFLVFICLYAPFGVHFALYYDTIAAVHTAAAFFCAAFALMYVFGTAANGRNIKYVAIYLCI